MCKHLIELILDDLRVNPTVKSKVIVTLFRIAHASLSLPKVLAPAGWLVRIFYRLLVDWVLGVDLPCRTKVGRRLTIYHGTGLVVNPTAVIGNDCILRHGVTIGNKIVNNQETGSPTIGDQVEFGANSTAIGPITIGNRCVIGANTVITKNLADDSVAVGSNNRIFKKGTAEQDHA